MNNLIKQFKSSPLSFFAIFVTENENNYFHNGSSSNNSKRMFITDTKSVTVRFQEKIYTILWTGSYLFLIFNYCFW